MAVPTIMSDLNVAASSNVPAATDPVFPLNDDYIRALASILRRKDAKGSDIASAATVNIGASVDGDFVDVTGTTTITSFGTVAAGIFRVVRFTGVLTLTHNATSLILPAGVNITTTSGDIAGFRSLGSGNWLCEFYTGASITKANITATGTITLATNNTFLQGKTTGGTAQNLIGIDNTDQIEVGDPNHDVLLRNNGTLSISNHAGSAAGTLQKLIHYADGLISIYGVFVSGYNAGSSRISTGVYEVTLSNAMSSTSSIITVSPNSTSFKVATYDVVDVSTIRFYFFNSAGSASDSSFSFSVTDPTN